MIKFSVLTLFLTLANFVSPITKNLIYLKPLLKSERTIVRSTFQPIDTLSRIPPDRAGNTDWFKAAGWGVFVHFLYDVQCVGDRITTMDGVADWDKCVNEFDTEKFAEQIKSTKPTIN